MALPTTVGSTWIRADQLEESDDWTQPPWRHLLKHGYARPARLLISACPLSVTASVITASRSTQSAAVPRLGHALSPEGLVRRKGPTMAGMPARKSAAVVPAPMVGDRHHLWEEPIVRDGVNVEYLVGQIGLAEAAPTGHQQPTLLYACVRSVAAATVEVMSRRFRCQQRRQF
jgi:hypothetical protein